MENYQIVILAGGLGTRLFPITKTIPKALVQVAGRPYIFWQLDLIKDSKIDEVILCVGFLGEQIEKVLGDNYRGIVIKYSYEQPDNLLGTAGAIKNAESFLNPSFGVLYGDSYLELDYRVVFKSHHKAKLPATMTVWKNENKHDISNVILSKDEKRVDSYRKVKKPGAFDYIDYGFSIFNKDIIESRFKKNKFAILDDLQRDLSSEGILGAFKADKRFYEVGSSAGIIELKEHLIAKRR